MSPHSIVIIDTYYQQFVQQLYAEHPEYAEYSYLEQRSALLGACFGTADYYSKNLLAVGWNAEDILADVRPLQYRWAQEEGLTTMTPPALPYLGAFLLRLQLFKILRAQIRNIKPDVIYMHNLAFCDPTMLRWLKKHCRLLVGQIACPMPPKVFIKPFDLILTSFPHFVHEFQAMGVHSEFYKIAFEESILDRINTVTEKKYDVVFIGGFTNVHAPATRALEALARRVRVDVWGYGIDSLAPDSPLRKHYHGEAWGLDMYRIFRQAKICINRHSAAARQYANNARLFETTGVGTLLITDQKENLNDLFVVGKEIVAYNSDEELLAKTEYYLKHEEEREAIAKAGQVRTLREHTYAQRMAELDVILQRYLQQSGRTPRYTFSQR